MAKGTGSGGAKVDAAAMMAAAAGTPPKGEAPRVRFDTSELKSSYCNVCNATSTREEVVLNFGINETWDRDQSDVSVRLTHRIIVSPYAAKRLHDLLTKLMTEHEARYGEIK
jgi:hypothetical protein